MLFSLKHEEKKYCTKEDITPVIVQLTRSIDTIQELDFTSNVFKPEAVVELCKCIRKMKNLKNIILEGIFATLSKSEMETCFKDICSSLKDKKLILLDLSNNALSSDLPEEFTDLLSNLNTLKFLKIRNCGLGYKGGNIIGECLDKLTDKNNFEYLDIAQNRFFNFPEKLCEGISNFKRLSVLRLEYNTIEKISMTQALKVIKDFPLEVLDIRDNFLDVEGCKLLGEIFATCNIRELVMGDCMTYSEGMLEFIKYANNKFVSMGLPGDCTDFVECVLDVSYNDWEQECIEDLIHFCKKYFIKKLFITGNLYDDSSELMKAMHKYGGELIYNELEAEQDLKSEFDDALIEKLEFL